MSPNQPAKKNYPYTLNINDGKATVKRGLVMKGETIRQVADRLEFEGVTRENRVTSEGSEYFGTCGGFAATFFVDLS